MSIDTTFDFINHIILHYLAIIKRTKLSFKTTLLKPIFGIVIVFSTLFLWSFPIGQFLLLLSLHCYRRINFTQNKIWGKVGKGMKKSRN